jgi:hypothetical protein
MRLAELHRDETNYAAMLAAAGRYDVTADRSRTSIKRCSSVPRTQPGDFNLAHVPDVDGFGLLESAWAWRPVWLVITL